MSKLEMDANISARERNKLKRKLKQQKAEEERANEK